MNDSHWPGILSLIGVIVLAVAQGAQFYFSSKNRTAEAHSNEADAIESLTSSVRNLNSDVRQLQEQLDEERIARRVAETKIAELSRRIVWLESENSRLNFENEALKEALDVLSAEDD